MKPPLTDKQHGTRGTGFEDVLLAMRLTPEQRRAWDDGAVFESSDTRMCNEWDAYVLSTFPDGEPLFDHTYESDPTLGTTVWSETMQGFVFWKYVPATAGKRLLLRKATLSEAGTTFACMLAPDRPGRLPC